MVRLGRVSGPPQRKVAAALTSDIESIWLGGFAFVSIRSPDVEGDSVTTLYRMATQFNIACRESRNYGNWALVP